MFPRICRAFFFLLLLLLASVGIAEAATSITSLTPTSGAVGASVTIAGSGFGATQGTSTVKFNGTTSTVTSWSATSIVATVPTGATTGNVVVTVSGTASNGKSFTVLAAPSISSLSPTSGAAGTSVTVTGNNFGASQGSSTVKFNGTTATPTSWSATSIKVPVPTAATTGNVVVHASGVDSNGKSFTVLPTPNITSLSPTSGTVGTSITVTGTNFGTTQGTSTLKFNGTAATPTSWSGTSIAVPVPIGATTGNVVVTVSGVASNGVGFTVKTLTTISVTPQNPAVAPGNTQQFTATGTYSDSSTQNLTGTAAWSSSATGVGTINASGLATAVAPGQTTIQASVGSVNGSTLLLVPGFSTTGNLVTARNGHTATVLTSGNILIVGGYDINGAALASAELYNPSTGAFTATGSLNIARTNFTATLLTDGTVLVAGGFDGSGKLLSSAETYNPTTATFTTTGTLNAARANHSATLLTNGKVLLAGSLDNAGNALAGAEIYDPSSRSFSPTGNLNTARGLHTATLLNDGTVLLLGGGAGTTILAGAELYSSTAGTFALAGSLITGRIQHTATLLNSGLVLVAGGQDTNANTLASAELYNPATQTFAATGAMLTARGNHGATLLNNGMVLVEGGFSSAVDMSASAELYDPVATVFNSAGNLNTARQVQTATRMINGMVLVAGGFSDSPRALASVELYEPATLAPTNLVSITVSPSSSLIPAGTVERFMATGTFSDNSTQVLVSVKWSSSNTSVATLTNDSGSSGIALGVASGSATITACAGSVCGSTTLTVVAADPDLASLSPTAGPVGNSLTLAGSGFGAMQGNSFITISNASATATSWSPTSITVTVPSAAQTGNVFVSVGGVSSNLVEFTVLPTPLIASVSPTSGDVGAPLQIFGQNFGDTQGSSAVTLNGTPISVTSWSATNITGTVPTGAATGNIVVTVSGVPSNAVSFTVVNVPAIFSLFPTIGPAGTSVAISGADFGASQGSSTVTFNGLLATVTGWSATSITAIVPTGTTTGPVVANISGTPSNGMLFVSPGPPNISSLSPPTAPIGGTVTINGTNFGASQGSSSVAFNGTVAPVTSWSPTQIVVTVPTGAATGNVTVTSSGVTGTSALFTLYTGPTITSFSPTTSNAGSGVNIQGSGFGVTQGASTVTFNGTQSTVTYWSDTLLQVIVPSGASTGNLAVTVSGITKNAGTFTLVPTPTITSVSPASAVVGTSMTVSGSGFGASPGSGGLYLPVAGSCCYLTTTSWTDTQIVAPLPAGASSGTLWVDAGISLSQRIRSNTVNFTVLPSITSLSPNAGTVATSIQINGNGFGFDQSTGTVTFNGVTANPVSWSPTQIVTYPPIGATSGNVVVTVSGNPSAGTNFTMQAGPAISSLSPTNGVVGISVTITGTGFGSSQGTSTVNFNGTPTAAATAWSATSITVAVPSGTTTGNVVVTVGGVASNGVSFTLDPAPSISSLSQTSGSIGTAITISGSNFLDTQGSSTVKFNGTVATPFFWSANTIEVNVPTGATTGNVVVTVLGQASAGKNFTVTAAPNISSLSPASGQAGILVSVNGSNFGSSQGASSVTFNGVPATPTSWASGLIKVPAPAGAGTGPVVVTINNGPSNNSTFTFTAGPGITSLSPTNGGIGATVTVTGAGFGTSQGSSTVKFNGTTASPSSWNDSSIVVPVPAGATTGNVVVAVTGTSSNGVSFTVASGLSVSAVAPNSGNTGESVVITGVGFGATQGSSTVKFNGSTASVTSWSNTSITTSVPSAATTGAVVVTVGGAVSDGINFTAEPQITGISPNPAAFFGNITITGENFGTTPGNSFVTCDGNQLGSGNYVSWTSTSVVVQECVTSFGPNPPARPIPVQITVNNIPSLPAVIEGIPDASLSSVYPVMAPVGASILIRGGNLGDSQGQSTVTVNGVAAVPTSWSNSGITVRVPPGATGTGQINVTVGGLAAYPAIYSFTVGSYPIPNSLRITPSGVNMLIGDFKQFTVVDELGRPRPEATWTIDNASLASISSDSSPTMTAIAAGTVTLTATVQGVSTQTQVVISSLSAFPDGTTLWSAPAVTGFSPSDIVQAVATDFGPDVYSIQTSSDGKQTVVQAFTSDGQQLWQSTVGKLAASSVPDGFGGIVTTQACDTTDPLNTPLTIVDQDGVTGGALWSGIFRQFSGSTPVCLSGTPKLAIRQDNAVVVAMPLQVVNPLMILNGTTGQTLSTPTVPPSTIQNTTGSVNTCDCLTPLGQPMVDSDGSTYVLYEQRNIGEFDRGGGPPSIGSELWLMKIAQDGTTSATQVSSSNSADLFPGNLLPDGQGGILATWAAVPIDITAPPLPHPYQAADVSYGFVTTFDMPMAPTQIVKDPNTGLPSFFPLVLGENGTAFVSYGSNITAFIISTGSVNWNYQAAQQNSLSLVSYSNGGGLVAKTTAAGVDTVLRFNSAGTPTSDSWTGAGVDYSADKNWWLGIPPNTALVLNRVSAAPVDPTPSLFPAPGQKRSQRALAVSVKINFNADGNHPNKTAGDGLLFLNGQNTCSENLGLKNCTSTSGFWLWNLEGNARVYNDASLWNTNVEAEYHFRGLSRDSSNHLQPFSCTTEFAPDGPKRTFLQQVAGQKSIFYLDAPGPYFTNDPTDQCLGGGVGGGQPIDSMTFVYNFTVTFSSKLSSYHKTVYYYVKFVISPGGVLDTVNSHLDYGNLPLNF